MLVALIMPWPQPAYMPMHLTRVKLLCVLTAQHRAAFQLQARLPLIKSM